MRDTINMTNASIEFKCALANVADYVLRTRHAKIRVDHVSTTGTTSCYMKDRDGGSFACAIQPKYY